MRRKEIKQLFEQMGLTYYPSKNPKNERWKIPNEDLTIRILVSYETRFMSPAFSSAPDPVETHWVIQIKGRFSSSLTIPEDAIKEIQRIIYNQFERQFNEPNDYEWEEVSFHGGGTWTQWSTYHPVTISETPKPSYRRPIRQSITKPQINTHRAKTHRLGYSGKR